MAAQIQTAIELFAGKINLLIVDDDANLRESLGDIFTSPLFNISSAATLSEAERTIDRNSGAWHCWIVDVDLGHGQSGLNLLTRYQEFPFAIVLSGLHRMALAAEAMRLGARIVLDKNPSSIDRLHDEACRIAALGFLLNGKTCADFDVFQLLRDDSITTIDEWSEHACITMRKLHRVCDLYPPMTPFYGLALYRTIYYLLKSPIVPLDQAAKRALLKPPAAYESWIDYTIRKIPQS